jgi:hypothetical protein
VSDAWIGCDNIAPVPQEIGPAGIKASFLEFNINLDLHTSADGCRLCRRFSGSRLDDSRARFLRGTVDGSKAEAEDENSYGDRPATDFDIFDHLKH